MVADRIKQITFQAYEGEAKASIRLQVFAERADSEGLSGAAGLFRALAAASGVHARNNMRLLGTLTDTRSNLSHSLETGNPAAIAAYEEMVKLAEGEGDAPAVEVYRWMLSAQRHHAELLRRIIEEEPAEVATELYVCDTCGYIADGTPPERCPVCGSRASSFRKPAGLS